MRIGLVGGSFDPPHLGHLWLAAALLWRFEPDELWLMPVARHPFGKTLSPFDDRLAMARIAGELLGRSTSASDLELTLVRAGGDGTTVSLLRHLRSARPDDEWLLALGADSYAERAAWREFAEVARLARVVVFNRVGCAEVEEGGPPLPAVSSTDVRARVRARQSIANLVPAAVERYIHARALYAA